MKPWSMRKKHRSIPLKKKSTLKDVCLSKSWPSVALKTMLYGPMKPVGLEYPDDYTGPRDGEFKTPYAVVQLRQDNAAGSLYNIVGFQTHLKWGEQKRVFQMIPGLENAEFVRYGVMHRNSYMDSPNLLEQTYRSKKQA